MWLIKDLEGLPVKQLSPSHSRESGQHDSPAGHWILREVTCRQNK